MVGDVLTDVLVVHHEPLAIGSDTTASITVAGGGQGANTAAWLAYAGCPVTAEATLFQVVYSSESAEKYRTVL